MGRSKQPRPRNLAKKLRQIRLAKGFTQQEMFEALREGEASLYVGHISLYESGQRLPPLTVLLKYARSIELPMDVLVDDELALPKDLD